MGELFVQLLQAYGIHQVDLAGIVDEKLAMNKEKFGVTNTFNTNTGDVIPAESYEILSLKQWACHKRKKRLLQRQLVVHKY